VNSTPTEISDAELKALTDAILKRYGLDFSNYQSTSLKRGFARIIIKRKLGSLIGLWSKILYDSDFFKTCFDDLLVNMTELFRNPEIWTYIRDKTLSEFKNKESISIWHAGCSTGEEVYTMSIVLHARFMLHKSKVVATDLSTKALEQAKKGEFNSLLAIKYKKAFDKYLPEDNFDQFFSHKGKLIRVKPFLKKHILFEHHNLVQDPFPKQQYDIVFCRNVLIYFDEPLKIKILKQIHASLRPRAYLIVGFYDILPEPVRDLFELVQSGLKIYRKRQ